ncbi:HlyD family secretion protein [Janthinobacterium sp. Mn2066]|uniref:HlyD family secretion protein n=1 Tax=Janthinobacterium sp. Mn2066 TaxID=3395264 RepID=UPI003BBB972E
MRDQPSAPAPATTPAPPVQPLFRQQAIEHLSSKQYGTVILARPVSHLFLTLLFLAIALAIIAFFIFFSTTRKAQSQGVLVPTSGVIRVMPGRAGVITAVRVKEGQTVKAGEVLFVLSGERSSSNAGAPQQVVSNLLKSRRDSYDEELKQSGLQARQRIAAAQRRASDLAAEIARMEGQIVLQQRRIALAEQSYKRYSELNATNYISAAQLQDKQGELLDQHQRLAELQRIQSASGRDLASAEADVRDLQVQAQRDTEGLQRNVSAVEQDLTENEARREIQVRALQDGMVTAITTELGQTVTTNSILASVLPAGAELEAEIYAPSRSVGFIKPGMQVLLRYQAYPYQKFGQYPAQVREVASTSLRPEELAVPGAVSGTNGEPLYRIRLKLQRQSVLAYGETLPLKSGMQVDASVLLEQRRLYEWVLEPLFSISGRL